MRLLLVGLALLPGCTSFANVRSARVRPGTSFDVQASFASSPGDPAGWLLGNDIECVQRCGGGIVGGEVNVAHGFVHSPMPFTVGAGLMGITLYGEGYLQLTQGERPTGLGARIALPIYGSRTMGQVYARVDVPVGGSRRVLWNPAAFHASDATHVASARVTGIVNGLALAGSGEETVTPSMALVLARARHDFAGEREGPAVTGFIDAAVRVAFGREPRARPR